VLILRVTHLNDASGEANNRSENEQNESGGGRCQAIHKTEGDNAGQVPVCSEAQCQDKVDARKSYAYIPIGSMDMLYPVQQIKYGGRRDDDAN